MMLPRLLSIGLICFACFGATSMPCTSPSTAPSVDALSEKLLAAQQSFNAASSAAIAILGRSSKYQAAMDEVTARQASLDSARRGDDSQAKLDASSAYNKALAVIDDMRFDAVKSDSASLAAAANYKKVQQQIEQAATAAQLVKADAAIHEQAKADAAAADARRREEADPINIAIKNHQLAIGMTLEQAEKVMGQHGRKVYEDAQRIMYEWHVYGEIDADFADGKIVSISRN